MAEKFDKKFTGIIYKNKDGSIVPADQWMCFLIKDDAFPNTLRFYREECIKKGAAAAQVEAIDEAIKRMDLWRNQNPEKLKVPDIQEGELLL